MKPILLAALVLPVVLAGCSTDVGYYDSGPGYYRPGYYGYYDGGYYGGPVVSIYGYDRGYYGYHHYDSDRGSRNTAFARSNTRVTSNRTAVASVNRSSGRTTTTRSASVSSGASREVSRHNH